MRSTLALKVGAPVVLVRNLQNGLTNGMLGVVLELQQGNPPIISFAGRIVTVESMRFDVYDPKQKKSLAARHQYPIKLAFALTVHRAQGMTLPKVEVDSYSFFAPGQLGVAVGRCVSTDGLRIINYNSNAAKLLHPEYVYDFYFHESTRPDAELVCCKKIYHSDSALERCHFDDEIIETCNKNQENKPSTSKLSVTSASNLPVNDSLILVSNEVVEEFIDKYKNQSFLFGYVENLDILRRLASLHFATIKDFLQKTPRNSEDFVQLYSRVNNFLISDVHQERCKIINSHKPQKLSSKLFSFSLIKKLRDLQMLLLRSKLII